MSLLTRLALRAHRLLLAPPSPRVAIEVRATTIGSVKLAGSAELDSALFLDIPPGILNFASLESPVADSSSFRAQVERLCEQAGIAGGTRVALVLPDAVARLSLIPRASLRGKPSEREDIARFRLKKLLPYDSHAARIALGQHEPGENVLVAAISASALLAFEEPFRGLGLDPGLVEVSGLALVRGLVPSRGDWLMVNWEPEYLSLFVVRNGGVLLIRNFALPGGGQEQDVAREVGNTVLYHRERLGGRPLDGALLRTSEARAVDGARELQPALGLEPTIVAPVVPGTHQALPAGLAGAGGCLLAELA